jgi:RNA polymerase sigma factor (sigma-70 family)
LRAASADAPDLVQEVYLRLLRLSSHETIRSPQAYAFTVAFHVLHEHKLASALVPESVDPTELLLGFEAGPEDDPALQAERRQRIALIDRSLRALPRNVHAAFVLHRRFGFTVDEIAAQLGVSRGMVKKYLARAVAHCQWQQEAQGHTGTLYE